IRATLEQRSSRKEDPLHSVGMEAALSNCLSCKACTSECPSNVNMALLKAELLHAKAKAYGFSSRQRLFIFADVLGRVGCLMPWIANKALDSPSVRRFLDRQVGITAERPLPHYAPGRFDRWFNRRKKTAACSRGRVVLWDDTFVRYHEPDIGIAAVNVLEAAGFQVTLPAGRKCCGRPAFSQGDLDRAR